MIVLSYVNTSHGSVLVPGYGKDQYVALALFFGGTLAGFVSVIRELIRRNPALPPGRIGEVAIAATTQTGDQGLTIRSRTSTCA